MRSGFYGFATGRNDVTIDAIVIQKFKELARFADVGRGTHSDVRGNVEAGKFCRSDAFNGTTKSSGLADGQVVHIFAAGELKSQKEARIGAEFVDALAQAKPISMEENVAAGLV